MTLLIMQKIHTCLPLCRQFAGISRTMCVLRRFVSTRSLSSMICQHCGMMTQCHPAHLHMNARRLLLPSTATRILAHFYPDHLSSMSTRNASTEKQRVHIDHETSSDKAVTETRDTTQSQVTMATKVKEAGKTTSYMMVIVAGIAVTGLMFYAVGRELFYGDSANAVYTKALKVCRKNTQIIDTLGEPIKGHGETNRRGRRRHVKHTIYEAEGVPHMRMRFYIKGTLRKATVHLEVKKNAGGSYEYRYMFVELDGYPHRTIILEDNR